MNWEQRGREAERRATLNEVKPIEEEPCDVTNWMKGSSRMERK